MKTSLFTFFNIKGTNHFEFIPQGKTVNQSYYVEIFKQLHKAVCRKWPELWPSDWILHHVNAPAHKVLFVKHSLAQKLITEMENPPSSPDLSLNDFWLFPKIKCALKGRQFQDTEDIRNMWQRNLQLFNNR